MEQFLQGQTLLITGASSGIGQAVAIAAAQHGARTVLIGRHPGKLSKTSDSIVELGLLQPAIYPLNLLKAGPDDMQHLSDSIKAEFGGLDGVIHCAGIMGTLTPIEHYDASQWLKVVQVNLNAPFLLVKTLLPLLSASKRANILLTLADSAEYQQAYWGAYGVSKHGLQALVKILADELENNGKIKVFGVNPGQVKSKMRCDSHPALNPALLTTVEDAAKIYMALLADNERQTSGQTIGKKQLVLKAPMV